MLYIFQHNISKFYYCYDYVPSVERYIFQTFIYVRFFLLRLSAACFSFLLLLALAGFAFLCRKKLKHKFPWKWMFMQSRQSSPVPQFNKRFAFDALPRHHWFENGMARSHSVVFVVICFPEINISYLNRSFVSKHWRKTRKFSSWLPTSVFGCLMKVIEEIFKKTKKAVREMDGFSQKPYF